MSPGKEFFMNLQVIRFPYVHFLIFFDGYSKLYSKIYLELIKPKRTDLKMMDEKVLEWSLRKQTTEGY